MKNRNSPLSVWKSAIADYAPPAIFSALPKGSVLCWGKFAYPTWKHLSSAADRRFPHLVIAPRESLPQNERSPLIDLRILGAEHPLPREGSFEAGRRLLSFFSALDRYEVPTLDIYLSGGSSSLAWLRPRSVSPEKLQTLLRDLYRAPFTIEELNLRRARLCGLKGGGAARLLRRFSPHVFRQTRVHVVSDVAPFPLASVGSGPFWGEGLAHEVVADNRRWVHSLDEQIRRRGEKPVSSRAAELGTWQGWAEQLGVSAARALERTTRSRAAEWLILGGEPQVHLPKNPGRGGRQSQIAASLLLKFAKEIATGRLEILCGSTDGVDGASQSSGSHLTASAGRWALKNVEALRAAIRSFDSASALAKAGALLPERPGGVNLQDAVLVRVSPAK